MVKEGMVTNFRIANLEANVMMETENLEEIVMMEIENLEINYYFLQDHLENQNLGSKQLILLSAQIENGHLLPTTK